MAEIINNLGEDDLVGTDENDVIKGLGGNDIISAGLGNDRVEGGSGNDDLFGEEGRDNIIGGTGRDCLSGGEDSDRLQGGSGSDMIIGGPGNDSAQGGRNGDIFVVSQGDESLTILDFEQGLDKIVLAGFGVEDVSELELEDATGGGTLILLDDDSVRINDVSPDDLSNADFAFEPIPFQALTLQDVESLNEIPDIFAGWLNI
ncbi:calcium-binding protein [Geminicoccus harenae]|uniref:calcium-binding protein n=1 Tax=Geminicoccus harenae TaxID=2498453 RepID=UPI00168A78F7|nr:calcium-binding protein [Geminicoccus harenae]